MASTLILFSFFDPFRASTSVSRKLAPSRMGLQTKRSLQESFGSIQKASFDRTTKQKKKSFENEEEEGEMKK